MDWIPRTIRQRQKKIDAVIKEVEQTTGRSATDEDIAAGLGISSEEYLDWQSQMKITGLISLNEYMDQGSDVSQDYSRHTTARLMVRKKVWKRRTDQGSGRSTGTSDGKGKESSYAILL